MSDHDRRDNLLGALVLTLADRIRDETEGVLGHAGGAAAALAAIAQQPGGTVEDLRRAIGRSHPASVRIVDRLVELGLVTRRPSGRGPAVALTATAEGRERAREILAVRRRVIGEAMPELAPDEAAALTAILERALEKAAELPRGVTVCRLCDKGRCRRDDCPVARGLAAQGVDLPPPAAL
jgi:MarR family transcriptional regulator, negative regulator of the multidrug operon emrRAB